MLKRLGALLQGIAMAAVLAALWLVGLFFGLRWFLHGINGYPRCPGVEPGGSCSFDSARGTIRVPYEDLEQVELVSLLLGTVTLLALAVLLLVAVALVMGAWWARD